MTMEKYSRTLELDDEQIEKYARKGCPECGSKVEVHGSTVICPKGCDLTGANK